MKLIEIYENEIKPKINYLKELDELNPVKKGDYYVLICPGCGKKEAYLYPNTGLIECNRKNKCFYSTQFLAHKNGGTFPRGEEYINCIKELGESCGIIIDDAKDSQFIEYHNNNKTYQQTLEAIWKYFQTLIKGSKGEEYLKSRNLESAMNMLGLYPTVGELKSWVRQQKDIDETTCEDLGLFRTDFEGRLIGDWRTTSGDICNFWARSLDGKEPKYSRLKKNDMLDQEYPQGSDSVKGDTVIWVEGHLDVIAARLSGFNNVVGCGAASVPEKALERLRTSKVTLCLDNDKAGQDGTFNFIKKNLEKDLPILVVEDLFAECKDLADVFKTKGKEAVEMLLNGEGDLPALTFAAQYILDKHKSDGWSDCRKINAMVELEAFSKKIPPKKAWEEREFFWTAVQEELNINKEDIEALSDSIEDKKFREKKGAMLHTCNSKITKATENKDIEEAERLHEELGNELKDLNDLKAENKESRRLGTFEEMEEEMDQFTQEHHGKNHLGITVQTLTKINDKLLGLRGLILLAAAPNVGKTALTIQLGLEALKNNEDVCLIYVSLEMKRREIFHRMLLNLSEMNYKTHLFGSLPQSITPEEGGEATFYTKEEAERIKKAKETLRKIGMRLQILDRRDIITPDAIIKKIESVKKATGANKALVVIDYLQIWPIDREDQIYTDQEGDKLRINEVKKIVDLMDASKECVLLISEARKPSKGGSWGSDMSDVMGTARTTYAPDIVALLTKMTPQDIEKLENGSKDYEQILKDKEAKGISLVSLNVVKVRDGMERFRQPLEFHFFMNIFKPWDIINVKLKESKKELKLTQPNKGQWT